MEENFFKKIMIVVILTILFTLAFFLLKPILLAVIFAVILAFIISPVYDRIHKKIKSGNLSAFIICGLLLILIITPLVFLTTPLIDQSIKLYMASQQIDFVTPLKKIFPSLFLSEQFSAEIAHTLSTFVTKATNSIMNELSNLILDLPNILLQITVILFTFFFTIRDKDKMIAYVKSLLPFSSDIENKLLKSTKDITLSVIYGLVIVGTIQGVIVGIGFFIFGVPNALLLTFFAILVGILPVVGPSIIYIPVAIYFLIGGNIMPAIGVVVFGLVASVSDSFLRSILMGKQTELNPAIAVIGMIGGIFLFGILGIVIGPLILSYLLIVMDLFKKKV